ncbi:MAG: hypothetical protein P8Y35_07365 [Sulfurovaceae bacterium]
MKKTTTSEALLESKHIQEIVGSAVGGTSVGETIKNKIVAGYLSIAMQHHSSIIFLIEKNLQSSAAALLRPLVEAFYRGAWFALVAKDSQAEAFNNSNDSFKLKNTYKLARDIDRQNGDNETFHIAYKRNSKVLHGFTHGGIEQITRQFNDDTSLVVPSFNDEELIEILINSNVNLAMILFVFAININNSKLKEIAEEIIKN